MNESVASVNPLHMRGTTDFVLSGIRSFNQLQGIEQTSGVKYLEKLSVLLEKSKLTHSTFEGAYAQIYNPQNSQNVATKIFDTIASYDRCFAILREHSIGDRITDIGLGEMEVTKKDIEEKREIDYEGAYKIGQKELKKILENQSYIKFASRKIAPHLEDLNETEEAFLYIAWEHVLYQKLYDPYVLPSVFVAYKAPEDILGATKYNFNDNHERGIIERLKSNGGQFNKDGFRIIVKKGETAYAMIQDFQDLGQSPFDVKPENLTEKQRSQLSDFARVLEKVYQEKGYYPDSTFNTGQFDNLVFNKKDGLVLIDSNHIINRRYEKGGDAYMLNNTLADLKKILS